MMGLPECQITTIIMSVQFIVLHSEGNLQQTSLFLLLHAFIYSNYISISLMLFISYGTHQIRKDKKGKAHRGSRQMRREFWCGNLKEEVTKT